MLIVHHWMILRRETEILKKPLSLWNLLNMYLTRIELGSNRVFPIDKTANKHLSYDKIFILKHLKTLQHISRINQIILSRSRTTTHHSR